MFSVPGLAQFLTSGGAGQAQFYTGPLPGATIVSGAGAANMSNVGMTALVTVYQDDVGTAWNLPMDFYFLGTNYGKNLNGGMGWTSNFVISFAGILNGSGSITWPNTTPGVCMGNADRATNTFHYSGLQTSGSVQYINCVHQGQNAYNDSLPYAVKYQYRLIRDPQYQYIEIRAAAAPGTQGTWKIVSGPPGGNVLLATGAYVGTGLSGVWRSTATGTNWTWFGNSYVTF